jgi:hypothetical protein
VKLIKKPVGVMEFTAGVPSQKLETTSSFPTLSVVGEATSF